jgi:predicted translin family RNA/ssDNA-binding protein
MLNKTFQKALLKEYQERQQQRHELISVANDALRQSKQAIFSLHRLDMAAARKQLDAVNKTFVQLQKTMLKKNRQLAQQGAYLASVEEYLEAELFYQAMNGQPISAIKNLELGVDQYIGALSDLTGELTRQAVLRATDKDYETVKRYTQIVEEVIGALIEFDLVSHLRQKYDDAKRNLKRLEGIQYDISLRD